MTYRGRVQGGVIVLAEEAHLPEGVEVEVAVPRSTPVPGEPAQDPLFGMADLAVTTGVTDLATNVDQYLYGHPKLEYGS